MSAAGAVRLLRDFVAIPSLNPMGRTDIDPAWVGERRYAEHAGACLRRLGLDVELVGDPERPSLLGRAEAPGARETIMVASHLDTVPVDGMEIDPFDPRIEDDRLYGRGACDTKPGLACLLAALERVLAAGTLRRNLWIVGEADEEGGSEGAHRVAEHLRGREPDWAIVTEPTEMRLLTAHKGVVRAQLEARGVACHSSDPSRGRNALSALARAILALEALGERLSKRAEPRLGVATLSVGLAGGGSGLNIVPDHAWLGLDRRLLPGEDEAVVRAEIEQVLAAEGLEGVSIDWLRMTKPPLRTAEDQAGVRACLAALSAAGLDAETAAAAFATDGGIFAQHGVPSVVLGPGSIAQAHTAREWVPVAEVEQMEDVYRRVLQA
jgi:acetylornithine deacetylase